MLTEHEVLDSIPGADEGILVFSVKNYRVAVCETLIEYIVRKLSCDWFKFEQHVGFRRGFTYLR